MQQAICLTLPCRKPEIGTVRGLRVLSAALLFLAFALGVPLHAATAHDVAAVASATHVAHSHEHGSCCHEHHCKTRAGALCQMACAAAVAVLDNPPGIGTQLAYTVQFTTAPPASSPGVTLALDPFPPRPSPIA